MLWCAALRFKNPADTGQCVERVQRVLAHGFGRFLVALAFEQVVQFVQFVQLKMLLCMFDLTFATLLQQRSRCDFNRLSGMVSIDENGRP